MWTDLSWAAQPILASTPFLPAGKGALILTLGGLAMLALTAVLSRIMAGPPPKPVPDRSLRGRAERRETGHARAPPSSAGRRDAEAPPKPAAGRTKRKPTTRRKTAAKRSSTSIASRPKANLPPNPTLPRTARKRSARRKSK